MAAIASFPLAAQVAVPRAHWDGLLAVDLMCSSGTPVLAVFDGNAVAAQYPLGGNTVMLTSDDGVTAYYAHLLQPGVSGRVSAGQQIGLADNSGNAAGRPTHLHFALGQIDSNGAGTIAPWDVLPGLPGLFTPTGEGDPGGVVGAIQNVGATNMHLLYLAAAAAALLLVRNPAPTWLARARQWINPEFFTEGGRVHPIRASSGYDPEVDEIQQEARAEHERAERYRGIKREYLGRLGGGVDRPPWAVGLTDAQLTRIARDHGIRATQEGWWERAHLLKGSGELKRLLIESGVRLERGRTGYRDSEPATHQSRRQGLNRKALPW